MFDGKEYVYAVYEEKSFSKAAQKLYITQPALSTAIKKVEKKIGSPIFDRSTSPIGLTPSGEVYIDAIEKLFALEQNTINQLNNLNGDDWRDRFSDLLYPSQPSGGVFTQISSDQD